MKPKILITVRGGLIQAIASTSEDIQIWVADYDNITNGNYGDLLDNWTIEEPITDAEFEQRIVEMQKEDDENKKLLPEL